MKSILFIPIISLLLSSCSKTKFSSDASALTIVNTVDGSQSLVTNFSGNNGTKSVEQFKWYNAAFQIPYGSYAEFSSYNGPTSVSLSSISDTLDPIWSGTINIQTGSIQSLFINGTFSPGSAQTDTLLITDNIPYYPISDSLTGFRFVNLSLDKNAISVDIQNSPNISLVNSLSYKKATSFQSLPDNLNAQTNGYIFEFRDMSSGTVLTTFSPTLPISKSQTLVLYGSSSNGEYVMAVNNY